MSTDLNPNQSNREVALVFQNYREATKLFEEAKKIKEVLLDREQNEFERGRFQLAITTLKKRAKSIITECCDAISPAQIYKMMERSES